MSDGPSSKSDSGNSSDEEEIEPQKAPPTTPNQKNSMAHNDFKKKAIIVFHVDLEHAGDDAGVVQLSVVAHDPGSNENIGEFNEYVRPPCNKTWTGEK